jgi:hypothetical protein
MEASILGVYKADTSWLDWNKTAYNGLLPVRSLWLLCIQCVVLFGEMAASREVFWFPISASYHRRYADGEDVGW